MYLNLNTQIKRALQGDAEQEFNLGLRYYLGDEVIQDFNSALALFTQSADHGFNKAQFHLALMYFEGHGIEKNYQLAYFWFSKAADSGNIWGHYYMALMQRNKMLTGVTQKRIPDLWVTRSIEAFKRFNLC
ncbi:MAG: sel1 repeat family protein [Gammaproteobacteria bacterium]|nr:sel1 repeat family protein [Gammaproteobacteria bacterium]